MIKNSRSTFESGHAGVMNVRAQAASVAAPVAEDKSQAYSEDSAALTYPQEPSPVVSLPPTPSCAQSHTPHLRNVSPQSTGNVSTGHVGAFDSPRQLTAALSLRLQRLRSSLRVGSVNRGQTRQILVLGAASFASYSMYGLALNRVLSFTTGCSPGLIGHLQSLGLAKHASNLCSKGYNRLADLLHLSEQQCASSHLTYLVM
jgi:hypothetical protein